MSYIDELLDKNLEAKQREAAEQQIQQQQQQAEQPNEHQFINDDLFFKGAVASQTKQQAEQLSPPPPYVPGEPFWESFKQKEEPKAPDEKEFKNSMRVASIAQALAIMGDAFAAGKGANVKERKDTALEQISARQRQLRDIYEQRLEKYKEAGYAARAQDAAMKEAWRQREYQRELADYQLKEQRIYNESQKAADRKYTKDEKIADRQYAEDLQKENREYQEELQKERLAQDFEIFKKKTNYQISKGVGSGKTPQKIFTAKEQIEIDKMFTEIPVEWLKQYGYTEAKTRKVYNPKTFQEVNEEYFVPAKLDHERKLELIGAWIDGREPSQNATTTTPSPATNEYTYPFAPKVKKTIKGF